MEKITYRAYFSKNLYFEFDRIETDPNRAYFFKGNTCICSYWRNNFKLKYIAKYSSPDIVTFIEFSIKEI